jgi:hypothetical protein
MKQQASTTEVDEVANRLQREFLLVSSLCSIVFGNETWLVDSGASFHMIGARELFKSLTDTGSNICVEIGMGTRNAVHETRIVQL